MISWNWKYRDKFSRRQFFILRLRLSQDFCNENYWRDENCILCSYTIREKKEVIWASAIVARERKQRSECLKEGTSLKFELFFLLKPVVFFFFFFILFMGVLKSCASVVQKMLKYNVLNLRNANFLLWFGCKLTRMSMVC